MDDARVAPLVGIVGCLGVLGTLLYPYLAADGSVGTYYGSGVVNPLVAGLLALVGIIVLAAGREARTDPGLAAGVGLVFGIVMVLLGVAWGATVRVDTVILWEFHRWSVAITALPVAVGSAWYSRALGLL